MRSIIILTVASILTLSVFACSGETDNPNVTNEVQKESIVKSPPTSTTTPIPPTPVPPTSVPTTLPKTSTSTPIPPTSTPTQVSPTSTPTQTPLPVSSTQVAPTSTPRPTQIPTTSTSTTVKVCDWSFSYKIQDGFIDFIAESAPKNHDMENMTIEFTPVIRGFKHPIFNETEGFALHEYSQQTLDISKSEQQIAIPKAKTAYRMDIKIVLVGSTIDGRNCQQELYEAFTRSDDYYPSPLLSLPDNAQPNLQRYAEHLPNIPKPNAQSIFLATSMGDWNGNWEIMDVRKLEKPIRIGFHGDVGLEDYETVRDLLEILAVIAPDLDISYANSIDDVTLPIHFVNCTELITRDDKNCKGNGLPSGSLSGSLMFRGSGSIWVRISDQRINRHTLTHELGHALGLFHWNLENCSMCYGHAQTPWLSEWDLMALSAIHHSGSDWMQSRDNMREALGIPEDDQWTRYAENSDLLGDMPEPIWVELANLLENQAIKAIQKIERRPTQTQTSPTDTPTKVPTPGPTAIPEQSAKQKLVSMGYNVPVVGTIEEARQEYVASSDIPDKYRQRFIEIQENLNSVLGGYPNYIYFAYNKNGTEEDAKPVLDRMTELRPNDKWTIQKLIERQSCLGGANPGGTRTSTTNPYSVCLENLAFIESPWGSPGEPSYYPYIKMALHLGHEYFHHYQRVHALDRGLDYQQDRKNPETTVQAPTWWIEGAAVAFQNAWYRENWQSLPGLMGLTLDEALDTNIATVADSRVFKENRRNIMGYGDSEKCTPDWYMSSLDETYDTYTGCSATFMASAYLGYLTSYKTVWIDIPQDYYDLGFWGSFEKHVGMNKQEFYDSYNEFLRTGDPDDEPPEGWAPPENYISEHAHFLKIVPES